MEPLAFTFQANLWIYPGEAAWHFITVPPEASDEIEDEAEQRERRGFGSVKVQATIGESTWRTSVFPDKRSGCYLLPVKKQVRLAERLEDGDDGQCGSLY